MLVEAFSFNEHRKLLSLFKPTKMVKVELRHFDCVKLTREGQNCRVRY